MFDALGDVLDVRFEERTFGNDHGLDAWILLSADWETLRRIASIDCPSYAVISADQRIPCGASSAIEFSRHQSLPSVLAGRVIMSDEAVKLSALPRISGNMTVLASKAWAPVWTMQDAEGQPHHYVSLPVPELQEGEPLFRYFLENRFFQLLPLVLFLQDLTGDRRWEQPSLQACFMFDDPNLHWRSYGFVDFANMAAHAQMHNYHVSFATIPLDAWFAHKPTVQLFRQYRSQLSLLIHGNDHITQELARPYAADELNRSLQQALGRIDEFERRSGVEVSRVMVPPHGACGESVFLMMAQLGYEAACISKGSLHYFNEQASWAPTLGIKPAEIIGGLPVFARFPFSGNCRNTILIAALLHQPIIAMGHHHDVADGLHLLADVSEAVNAFGKVRWSDMKGISRSYFARKNAGRLCRIRMFTNRIEFRVPEGIDQVRIERPSLKEKEAMRFHWRPLKSASEWKLYRRDEAIAVMPGQEIEIISEPTTRPFSNGKSGRSFRLWPVARRQLTEARDRLAPLLRRAPSFSRKSDK